MLRGAGEGAVLLWVSTAWAEHQSAFPRALAADLVEGTLGKSMEWQRNRMHSALYPSMPSVWAVLFVAGNLQDNGF